MTHGALSGVRVLELGRYIAAPYGSKMLADMGADVIKVEDADRGDPMRVWQQGKRLYSPQFSAYNRNKRAIALDLKSSWARDAFLRLADSSDVVIENFRPGVADRLGVGWETLSQRNPRLVYCSITGFGSVGPYVHRPAYDTVISAMSGLYGMILHPESPRPVGPAFSDLLSGQIAAFAIVCALHERSSSGAGQRIDISMIEAVLGFLTEAATNAVDTGEVTGRDTRQRRAQAYGLTGSDDLPFVVHMSVPERFWLALTEAMDVPQLRDDPRFVTREHRYENYEALEAELAAAARQRQRADWIERLTRSGVPVAPVNTIAEVFADPQVAAMGIVETVDSSDGSEPTRMVGDFARLSRTPIRTRMTAPRHGEHTAEILRSIGVSVPTEAPQERGVL